MRLDLFGIQRLNQVSLLELAAPAVVSDRLRKSLIHDIVLRLLAGSKHK